MYLQHEPETNLPLGCAGRRERYLGKKKGRAKKEHDPFIVLVNFFRRYPITNSGMQNGSSVGICTHCIHGFACLAPICMLIRCLLKKILHRSSVRSLLRVRYCLGTSSKYHCARMLL